jgi:hypothetical protein
MAHAATTLEQLMNQVENLNAAVSNLSEAVARLLEAIPAESSKLGPGEGSLVRLTPLEKSNIRQRLQYAADIVSGR